MTPAVGLRTHIWNNNLKSILLLVGFPFLLLALLYAGTLLWLAYEGSGAGQLDRDAALAGEYTVQLAPFAFIAALIWFGIAWLFYQRMIDAAVGAKEVTRESEPRLWNLLENLCIARGLTMPSLRIIETAAMNAYASGLSPKRSAVTVTRGLMDGLDDDELEAVLAHELTHILNRDVRLLVIAVIFAGVISFVGEILARGLFRGSMVRAGGARRGRSGNAGVLIIVAIGIIALAWVLAILIRFAMSRTREYMADAGAVELTRNPDGMIGALQKISGRTELEDAPAEIKQMFLHDTGSAFAGLIATHPSIDKRINALQRYAGGVSSLD